MVERREAGIEFPQIQRTFAELHPGADLEAVAARLEYLYFVPDFKRFAIRGAKGNGAPWYYCELKRNRVGWCRNSATGKYFPRSFSLAEHLTTDCYFGTCLSAETGTRFAARDFDNLDDPWELSVLRDCIGRARGIGLTPHVVYTGNNLQSGHHLGAHLEFFFDAIVPVGEARRFLDWLTDGRHDRPGTACPEAFPTVGGMAYRLPFAVHRATGNLAVFVHPDDLTLIEGQADYVLGLKPDARGIVAAVTREATSVGGCTPYTPAREREGATPPRTESSCVPDFSLPPDACLMWLQTGHCPPHQSYSVIGTLARLCAGRWQLPRRVARQALLDWNARLPSANHATPAPGRDREIELHLRMSYGRQGTSGDVVLPLRDYWASDGRSEADRLVATCQVLDSQLVGEPRPNTTRRAIVDVLGVFIAAEVLLSVVGGIFYLSQRTIQETLRAGADRVNRVVPYIVRREEDWCSSHPTEGCFYRQVNYPSRRSRQAPSYRRLMVGEA